MRSEADRNGAGGRFFGSFPVDGVWTNVGLTRAQFLWVIVLSTLLFIYIDGPLWNHLRESHLARIVYSYAFIPPAVGVALAYNRQLRWTLLAAATVVIGLVKLLLTAVILVGFGLMRA